ncbi:MAG: 3'-5' exonuclease, partial [bacterium]|nr:3'-5' exonuclease [bacterium]
MDRRLTSGFVVFDLEANADRSDPPAHEIIEIGAVAVERDNEIGQFSTLVRPTRPLRDITRELTGLNDNDLADSPTPAEALEQFYRFVGNRPLVAHNGFGYDFRLLDAAAEATGVGVPDVPRLDSLELAHLVFPRARRGATANVDGTRPPQGRSLDELA